MGTAIEENCENDADQHVRCRWWEKKTVDLNSPMPICRGPEQEACIMMMHCRRVRGSTTTDDLANVSSHGDFRDAGCRCAPPTAAGLENDFRVVFEACVRTRSLMECAIGGCPRAIIEWKK